MSCFPTRTAGILASMLVLASGAASADTRTWPGTTPCNASLQTCVNAASQGDRIEIATDTPIAETVITSNRNISVVAATGFHPRFAAGHNLGISSSLSTGGPSFMQVTVAGIAFDGTQAHSAVYDTERTAELFCRIVNRWRDLSLLDVGAVDERLLGEDGAG